MGWGELGGDGVEFGISFASAHRSAAGAMVLRRLLYSCCCSRRSRMPHAPPPGARSCGASSGASSCLGRGSWLCAIPSIWLWVGDVVLGVELGLWKFGPRLQLLLILGGHQMTLTMRARVRRPR